MTRLALVVLKIVRGTLAALGNFEGKKKFMTHRPWRDMTCLKLHRKVTDRV